MTASLPKTVAPDPAARARVEKYSGEKISACYQCEKCSNGCPVTSAMDILPHQLMHLLNLGALDKVLQSDTIWVCASCETCTTRCPNGLDIAHTMDTLRQECRHQGIKPDQYSVPIFHSAFLSSVKRHGRVNETELALNYYVEDSGWLGFMKQAGLGFALFLRGKLKLKPERVRAQKDVKKIFESCEAKHGN